MPHDQAYLEAEKKIEEALRSGATKLLLYFSNLTELPESLGNLTQLEELNLTSNELVKLPKSLVQLTQLRSLNLSKNKFAVLPEWIDLPRKM